MIPPEPKDTESRRRAEGQLIEKLESPGSALMRMVDFKIPLVWLLGGFIACVIGAVNMYYQLQEVSKALAALTVTVHAGNTQYTTLSGQLVLHQFRIENLEADVRRIQGLPPAPPPAGARR